MVVRGMDLKARFDLSQTPRKTNDSNEDGLQPVSRVAKFLSVSRSKVYAMMESGDLRYVKLGKSRRIRWSDVLQMIEDCTVSRS